MLTQTYRKEAQNSITVVGLEWTSFIFSESRHRDARWGLRPDEKA